MNELVICPKCKASVKIKRIKTHFLKAHFSMGMVEANLLISEVNDKLLFSENTWKKPKKKQQTQKVIPKKPKNFDSQKRIAFAKIDQKCTLFNIEFSSFYKTKYFELVKDKWERLMRLVTLNIEKIEENPDLPAEIRPLVLLYEKEKLHGLFMRLKAYRETTIDKDTFIKEQCNTIYISWDDLTFDRNKIRVSVNKAFVQPIEMPGSIKIYNEIKVDYFKRMHSKDIYKLIIHKGFVMEELSRGVEQIRNLIANHAADLERSKKTKSVKKEIPIGVIPVNNISETLSKLLIKNEYLSVPAALLNYNDRVYGILENNKGAEEEALLFYFMRGENTLVLWENINPNRAGYLFVFKNGDNQNINKLRDLIKTNVDYKRHNLHIGTHTKKTFDFYCIRYHQLNHSGMWEYKSKLRMLVL